MAGKYSASVSYAKTLFNTESLPESATDLRVLVNISIENGVVVKNVSRISYLPTFTKAHDDGTETLYWDDATTELTLVEAAVVLPSGKAIRMDPDNIRVRATDEYNTFTNSKDVLIPLSGAASGSMTVIEYEKEVSLNKLESLYSDVVYPVAFLRDVSSFELIVEHDDSMDINWFSDSEVVDCAYKKGRLACSGQKLEKMPYDTSMVWRDELPSIVISEKTNWNQVIEHIKTAFEKSDYNSASVKDFAADLIGDVVDLENKIEILHGYASRSIRYVSMSELGHRITPHRFEEVVENLFGDCKDKSALLVGMLQSIGIDAFPVLVATERRAPGKIKVPSSVYFDHMVVCFDQKGEKYCLDPTNTSTTWQTPPSWIQGRVALELIDGSKPGVVPLDKYKWKSRSKLSMQFDSLANVTESQSRSFSGPYAGHMREGLLSLDSKERLEWLVKNYHETVSSLAEPEFEVELLESQGEILRIRSNAKYEPYYAADQNLFFTEHDPWVRNELLGIKVSAENYGVWVDGVHIESEVAYNFGGLWSVSRLPADLEFSEEFVDMRRTAKMSGNGNLIINTELKVKSHFVEPNDVESYNEMIDVLLTASGIHVEGNLNE